MINPDYIIIGSGAAGASAAKYLSEIGARVLILEEGNWFRRDQFRNDLFNVVDKVFRSSGNQIARGRSWMPVLQGCCAGGSTVINGAISHKLPLQIYRDWEKEWKSDDGALFQKKMDRFENQIMSELKMAPTISSVEELPIAKALHSLHWSFTPMVRNAPGCQGSGNCLQGCPTGSKLSMEASYLPNAMERGAEVRVNHKVLQIRKNTVSARSKDTGKKVAFTARKGILLAAGAIETPLILKRSGVKHPLIGENFQCHLSVGVVARLPKTRREMEGQPQGIEIYPPMEEGIKLATQLLPPELLFARCPIVGRDATQSLLDLEYYSSWTGSIKAQAKGSIRRGLSGIPRIKFDPTPADMKKVGTALTKIIELFFEMGAAVVYPGVYGLPEKMTSLDQMGEMPLDPRCYFLGTGHLFGTCRMGPDPKNFPVNSHFEVNGEKNLFVLDASLFPTSTGVNPQLPIMAMAMVGAEEIAERTF